MNHKLIIAVMLTMLSWPLHSQESSEATADEAASSAESSAFGNITALGNRVSNLIQGYFETIEALAMDKELVTAIKDQNKDKLEDLAASYQEQLTSSIKVRLYIKGKEAIDTESSPACGFACVDMVRSAYEGDPDAEALLFRTPDANMTLVRGIVDPGGEKIGAIVVHYPYSQLQDEIALLSSNGLFTELRQYVDGPPVVLFNHGDRTVKDGTAQRILRIPNTRWVIAVWTPGGVAVEEYEPPSLPWTYMALAVAVLVGGIFLLVVYRNKRPAKASAGKAHVLQPVGSDVVSYDQEHDSPTLIMGGGASDVDVSKYLKDDDITSVKIKVK